MRAEFFLDFRRGYFFINSLIASSTPPTVKSCIGTIFLAACIVPESSRSSHSFLNTGFIQTTESALFLIKLKHSSPPILNRSEEHTSELQSQSNLIYRH